MAEQEEITDPGHESFVDKISDKIHGGDDTSSSSSSSDSDSEAKKEPAAPSPVKEKIYRLFGREKPVHKVFGGGKRKYSLRARLLTVRLCCISAFFSFILFFLSVCLVMLFYARLMSYDQVLFLCSLIIRVCYQHPLDMSYYTYFGSSFS